MGTPLTGHGTYWEELPKWQRRWLGIRVGEAGNPGPTINGSVCGEPHQLWNHSIQQIDDDEIDHLIDEERDWNTRDELEAATRRGNFWHHDTGDGEEHSGERAAAKLEQHLEEQLQAWRSSTKSVRWRRGALSPYYRADGMRSKTIIRWRSGALSSGSKGRSYGRGLYPEQLVLSEEQWNHETTAADIVDEDEILAELEDAEQRYWDGYQDMWEYEERAISEPSPTEIDENSNNGDEEHDGHT